MGIFSRLGSVNTSRAELVEYEIEQSPQTRDAHDGVHKKPDKEAYMITVISLILIIVGAINWLSVGIFDFNIVNWIFSTSR